jgi:hypothetical protein
MASGFGVYPDPEGLRIDQTKPSQDPKEYESGKNTGLVLGRCEINELWLFWVLFLCM